MPEPNSFDAYLQPHLLSREPRLRAYLSQLAEFREWVLTDADAQANYTDRYAPPSLEIYDRSGAVANRVVVNPWYEAQHQEIYRRGAIGLPYTEGAPHLLSFTMGFLLSQADISLHCPVTLTGAVAYVLGYYASPELRAKYLNQVTRMDGRTATGGTWATEQHGGSDVGATTTTAVANAGAAAGDNGGRFHLHGLKWFTSNANSGLAIATARPTGAEPGSAGLGLYLVPSRLEDGSSNRYLIRRLKDKLGTKGLPTGEVELLGAEAVEIAAPPHGFKFMMAALEYSRVHNAVGAAGVQRRALREALKWAKSRRAFGHMLAEYPMVQHELLGIRVRFEAGTLLAFEAALAFDAALADTHADTRRDTETYIRKNTWLRLVTALAKYLTAEDAIRACRATLELIGGNGYTSDYPIARIYRDAQVLTVWEGPANIQALELLRLLSPKYAGGIEYERRVRGIIGRVPDAMSALRCALDSRLNDDAAAIAFVTASDSNAQRYARKLLERLSRSLAFAFMCEAAAEAHASGDDRRALTATRYREEIEEPRLGAEDIRVQRAAAELLEDETMEVGCTVPASS
jgi:alkylation response protein AidB-like acyl-CoA dehydrogenase